MRLQITKSANAECFYVVKSVYDGKKRTNHVVEKLGNLNHVKERAKGKDPYVWANEYVLELNKKEKEGKEPLVIAKYSPSTLIEKDNPTLFNGGYLFLQKIYNDLGLDDICRNISKKYDFQYDLNNILSRLVYGRILSPSSKLSTMEFSKTLLEQPNFELHQVYRALDVLADENEYIQSNLYKNSLEVVERNDNILYYDCTNYYFEIEEEDNFRKYGHSKENRPNPIVQMGLFLDGSGIPLAFSITSGNTNEQTTLKPLEAKIINDFKKSKFIVCTDAGLSSTTNRKFNDIHGRCFVTTQSVKTMKSYQKEWALDPKGWKLKSTDEKTYDLSEILNDGVLYEKFKDSTFFKERPINEDGLEQRFVVTFSIKYMLYLRNLRNQQLKRAQKLVDNPSLIGKPRQNDPKRFLNEKNTTEEGEIATQKSITIDEEKIEDESKYDGFYAVATNLDDNVEKIIEINAGRWEIEESFRIMKSELKARPVYLSRENRIRAHFMTCFLALMIYRVLEKKLNSKYTVKDTIKELRNMNFQTLSTKDLIPVYTRTDFTDDLHTAFGFRTDYEIITLKNYRKILKCTK